MTYLKRHLKKKIAPKCIQNNLLFMQINLTCLMTFLNFFMCLSLYMGYMGVMGYMDCTLNNFIHFSVHPEQPLLFMQINLMGIITLLKCSMCLYLYKGYIGSRCTWTAPRTTSCTSKCIQNKILFILINLMCLMTFLNFSMCLSLNME
jgi:hypothetical protein